jgi:hypothetical protein
VPRPTPSVLLTDRGSVEGLLSREGADLSLDDGRDGAVDAGEGARADDAIAYASAEVLRYCGAHYAGAQLELSASAWEWATVLAALRFRHRRGNPAPATLAQLAADVRGELSAVLKGELKLEAEVAQRVNDGPGLSNVTLDPLYRGRQVRVERPQSERTPRERPPAADYRGDGFGEP